MPPACVLGKYDHVPSTDSQYALRALVICYGCMYHAMMYALMTCAHTTDTGTDGMLCELHLVITSWDAMECELDGRNVNGCE